LPTTPEEPILKVAFVPPLTALPTATVADAVKAMVGANVGAIALVKGDKLAGIFTERDLMVKVVAKGLDPKKTAIGDVMSKDVNTLRRTSRRSKALETMLRGKFRHMPITEEDGKLLGMLSLRKLLQHQMERMSDQIQSLENFLTADGPGG
jgi:CBS domain-containing protein